MNRVDYINALKNALVIRKEEHEEIEQYHKMVLEDPDNVQFKAYIGLEEFKYSLIFPLSRVLNRIELRIREEDRGVRGTSKCSYPLMTIENVFENMTHDISLNTAYDIIKDKRLVCSPYAKSELIRSIKERNLQLFKDIIKEYNIDYKPASDICSRICIFSNMLRNIQDMCGEDGNAETLSGEESDEEFSLKLLAVREDVKAVVSKKLEEDGCSVEEISEYQNIIEELSDVCIDFSSPDSIILSIGTDNFKRFYYLLYALNLYAREQKLTIFDNKIITQFIEKKKAEMPIVQGFFTLFTKGDVLGDDFVFTEAEDDEFLEMIEQCVSTETNEQ